MAKIVQKLRCGTTLPDGALEEGFRYVMPARVYVSENGLYLITSQEWVDWLMDRVADMPADTYYFLGE